MKRKTYKLLSGAKQGLIALALTVFSGTAYSQATYTYNYTGGVQTITLQAGSYLVECWGADGGDGGGAAPPLAGIGGKGGYSAGVYTVASTTTLYIYVGGKGQSTNIGGTASVTAPGGWNGGGGGFSGTSSTNYKGGGGGGTDIRTTQNITYSNRIIVAGGGGGAGGATSAGYIGSGGKGGATSGQDGVLGVSQTNHNGKGGTQLVGGAGGVYSNSSGVAGGFGPGGDGGSVSGNSFPAGGGGGGWYGGGGGATQGGSGGGGSSYIGGVNSGTTIMSGQPGFVLNPDVTGNGRVLITELCSITLVSNASNSLNPSICSGQSLTLTTNAISNYSWSTGATSSSLVVSPTSNTVYGLTATSPSNCTASSIITVTVSAGLPVIAITSSTNNLCLGKAATLTASGALSYTWTGGVTNGVSFVPTVTDTYTVYGQNGCGTTSAVTSITVGPLPVSVVSSNSIICSGSAATLTANSAVNGYTWLPVNLTNSMIVVSPSVNTVYSVSVSDGTCFGAATFSLATNPVPTITAAASATQVCTGYPVILSAGGGLSYTWNPGNLSGQTITVNPTGATLYTVVGINSVGCTSVAAQIVITNQSPNVNVQPGTAIICPGDVVNMVASGNAAGYAWTNGPSAPGYSVAPIVTTVYTVTGTSSTNTCTTTKTVIVNVFSPVFNLSASSTTICSGSNVTLTASGADNYFWNTGSFDPQITVNPQTTTGYTVSASSTTLNSLTCSAEQTISIEVKPNPTVTATSSRTLICKDESTTLNANGAITYTWNTGNSGLTETVSPAGITIHNYTLTGSDINGCKGQSTIMIRVIACNGINENSVSGGKISVYPNPSNGDITVYSEYPGTFLLKNQLGQMIGKYEIDNSAGSQVRITGLSPGIYFMTGENGQAVKIIRN